MAGVHESNTICINLRHVAYPQKKQAPRFGEAGSGSISVT